MVHALQECWRVLVPDGALLDIRPTVNDRMIDVVQPDSVQTVAPVDTSVTNADKFAAHAAVQQVVQAGWFVHERGDTFDFINHFDTPAELKDFANGWTKTHLPDDAFENVRRVFDASPPGTTLRIRYPLEIARYRKV